MSCFCKSVAKYLFYKLQGAGNFKTLSIGVGGGCKNVIFTSGWWVIIQGLCFDKFCKYVWGKVLRTKYPSRANLSYILSVFVNVCCDHYVLVQKDALKLIASFIYVYNLHRDH